MFAAYGSRSHSIVEVQVPHSHNQDDHKCYRQWKINAFKLYTWSYENACSFLKWSSRKYYSWLLPQSSFKENVSDEDDDTFSVFKSSIDQLRQRDENLIRNDFTYKDI